MTGLAVEAKQFETRLLADPERSSKMEGAIAKNILLRASCFSRGSIRLCASAHVLVYQVGFWAPDKLQTHLKPTRAVWSTFLSIIKHLTSFLCINSNNLWFKTRWPRFQGCRETSFLGADDSVKKSTCNERGNKFVVENWIAPALFVSLQDCPSKKTNNKWIYTYTYKKKSHQTGKSPSD